MHFCLEFRRALPSQVVVCGLLPRVVWPPLKTVEDVLRSAEVSKELKAYYNAEMQVTLPERLDEDRILVFDSNFESGNLDRVSIVSLNEYNLFLSPDTNTKGHSQWFYFAVTNTLKGRTVTFNVLNCAKPSKLFRTGMTPLVFSELEYEERGTKWSGDVESVEYYRNDIERSGKAKFYHSLRFSHTFKHSGDKVYFAYTRPYTLGMCLSALQRVKKRLIENAGEYEVLEKYALHQKVKQFIGTEERKKTAEEQAKQKAKKTDAAFTEVMLELQKEFYETELTYNWMNSEDFKVESQGILYKQETLCKSFCGIPIVLLTVTNKRYETAITLRLNH